MLVGPRCIVNVIDWCYHTSYCLRVPVSSEHLSYVLGDLLDHVPIQENTGLRIVSMSGGDDGSLNLRIGAELFSYSNIL